MHPTRFASGPSRRLALFIALTLAGAGVTRACADDVMSAPVQRLYQVRMTLDVHGQASAPLLVAQEGRPFAVAGDGADRGAKNGTGEPWRATFTVHRTPEPGTVRVDAKITEGDAALAAPTLVGKLGERMAIKVGDTLAASLVVTERAP